jgi:cell wall-associated NlpC family hydrolase
VPAHALTSGTRVDLICYFRGQPVTGPNALTADPLWDETTGPGLTVKAGQVPVVPNAFIHTDHPVDQLIPPCDPTDSANSQTHSQVDGQDSSQSGAQAVVAYARAQLGKPYLFGATGPDAFDCSGLTLSAWAAAGVRLPRIASDQANAGTRTTRDALVPGDLIVSNDYGHVQLYIGDGNVIEAAHPGTTVDIGQLPPPAQVNAYVHPTPPTPR